MALGNWTSFGFDSGCNLTESFSVGDIRAEIYKNWTYLRSKSVWEAFNSQTELKTGSHMFATLKSGEFSIGPFHGECITKDNGDHFIMIASGYYHTNDLRWMAALGTYGYDGDEWIGVRPETYKSFIEFAEENIRHHLFNEEKEDEWLNKLRAVCK